MSAKDLLILGLLRMQETHGYQLNEMIDSHMGLSIDLKKPTMYALLKKMTDDGWITSRDEREGNRPPRRVYAITARGEKVFQRLLRESLANYIPPELHSDISIAFLDMLPRAEAVELLKKRRSLMAEIAAEYSAHGDVSPGGGLNGHQLVFEHQKHHFDSELQWLDRLIGRLEAALGEES
jgi:DNA-binding PadR family transcriptional regulator